MIAKATIEKYGLDSETLRGHFEADKIKPKVKKLVDLIADRLREGRLRNLSDYKIWAAVDMAYDTPFAQTTPTLIRNIMENCTDEKSVLSALRGWGLSEETLFNCENCVEGGVAKKKYHLNVPVLTNIFVPLVRAYLVIRLSKIFNDRNLSPLFEYAPLWPSVENRFLCEVVQEVVETIGTNFGYSAVLRDFIFNALMYSVSIKFPVDPWTVENQEDADGDEYIEKEGIRYIVPHVTRTFYDLNYPLRTLNTGTGCSFAGYWTIARWGEVDANHDFWNREGIPHGENWLDPSRAYHNYFTEVYPCTLDAPKPKFSKRTDREDMVGRYSKTDYDSAFFVSYVFMEIVPADWGIGDYANKVWMKFTVGADRTIMYAETFTYRPCDYIGYDADSGRGRNASLALEIVPFQDLTGNALTNYLLTVKRNLTNVVFYNNEAVDGEQIEDLGKQSQSQFTKLNFIGFDGLKMERSGVDMGNVFKSVTFPFADSNAVLLSLNTIISMLERVLVVAAQEIGASASHQQSKKEVEIANSNTSNRVGYTASFVDEGIDAWKRGLWEAVMTNMDGNEVTASVSSDIPDLESLVEKLGFEFVDGPPKIGHKKVLVKGKLSKQRMVQLVARRSDAERESDMQTGQAMMNAVNAVASNQFLSSVVDPASLVQLMEVAAKLMGADSDFKIGVNQDAVVAGQVQKIVGEIQQQIMGAVEKEIAAPAADAISKTDAKTTENAQQIEQLTSVLEQIQQMVSASQPLPSPNVTLRQNQQLPPPGGAPVGPVAAPPMVAPAPPAPAGPPPTAPNLPANQMVSTNAEHVALAKAYLKKARGNKNKARELAAKDGFKF